MKLFSHTGTSFYTMLVLLNKTFATYSNTFPIAWYIYTTDIAARSRMSSCADKIVCMDKMIDNIDLFTIFLCSRK